MAETDYLKLYKKDPILDRNDTFNITIMLNDNWDKINAESKRVNELTLNLTDNKVDKEIGKGLSTNDYTTEDKDKLAEIEAEANKYTHPATHDPLIIKQDTNNRFVTDTEKAKWNKATTDLAIVENDLGTHLADKAKHGIYIDDTTGDNYKWGIDNGLVYLEKVVV